MSTTSPLELGASRRDEDLRDLWAQGEAKPPVFIMGLHRSGTTILYRFMARAMPVAPVTVEDVVFYARRVHSRVRDEEEGDRRSLVDYFEANGLAHRALDAIPLSPETVEEYGWILKREAGSLRLTEKTLATFRDLTLKLSWMHPNASALLLKNPWDTPRADWIATVFPEARFVFLLRDPIEILNSELRNAQHFSSEDDPLVRLLTQGVRQMRFFLALARLGRRVLGERRSRRFLLWWLLKDIMNNLAAYRTAMERIAASRVIQVSYGELVGDTPRTLRRVADFLGLPLSEAAGELHARRRPGGLLPDIESQRGELEAHIEGAGLAWALGA